MQLEAECSMRLIVDGSLGNGGGRGPYHAGWPFGRRDPDDDVGDDIRTGYQRRKSPKNSNESRIHIEIVGYTGTDAGDFSVVRRAHKFFRRDIAGRHR